MDDRTGSLGRYASGDRRGDSGGGFFTRGVVDQRRCDSEDPFARNEAQNLLPLEDSK